MTLILLKETATEYWLCVFHSKSSFKPICFIAMNNSFDHAEQLKTSVLQNIPVFKKTIQSCIIRNKLQKTWIQKFNLQVIY